MPNDTRLDQLNREADERTAARLADPARPTCPDCNAPANVAPWGQHFCGKAEMLGRPTPDFTEGTWHAGADTDNTLTVQVGHDGGLHIVKAPVDLPKDTAILARARELFPKLKWTVDMREEGGGIVFEGVPRKSAEGAMGIVLLLEDGLWQAEACPQIATAYDHDPTIALQRLQDMLTDMSRDASSLVDVPQPPDDGPADLDDDDLPDAEEDGIHVRDTLQIKLLHLMIGSGPGGEVPRQFLDKPFVAEALAILEGLGLVHKGQDNWWITAAGRNEVALPLEEGNDATVYYADGSGSGLRELHVDGDEADSVHRVLSVMLGVQAVPAHPEIQSAFEVVDWKICARALVQAQERLQAEYGRQSWMDAACDIAEEHAQRSPAPRVPASTWIPRRRAEIRDGEDSSSACARACGEDDGVPLVYPDPRGAWLTCVGCGKPVDYDAAEIYDRSFSGTADDDPARAGPAHAECVLPLTNELSGWVARGDGAHTKRGWVVEPHYMGADGRPCAWIIRRPEGGTVQGGYLSVVAGCQCVDELLDQQDRAEIEREAGSPNDPLPPDASMAVLVSQFLLAWPDCETEALPADMARKKPGARDRLKVSNGTGPQQVGIAVEYVRSELGGGLHWRFATSRDPGRYSDPLVTIAGAVAEAEGRAT